MSGNINENTFVGLTYHELSQEGFGLPSIRNLRAPSEKYLFNSPIVKAAAAKAKAYGIQKGYTNSIPVSEKDKEAYIKAIIWKRALTISRNELKVISKNVDFVKVNGTVIVKCKCNLSTGDHVVLGFIAAAVGASIGFALSKMVVPHSVINGIRSTIVTGSPVLGGVATAGTAAIEGGILGIVGTSFLNFITKKIIEKNNRNNLSIFASWVAFKNKDNKVVLKRFCNAIIDPNMYVPGREDLSISNETDEVSMTDLVENETTVEEDAGKDSEVTNINIPQDDSAHNEEASSGGVVTPDNKDNLEVKPTSDETSTEGFRDNMRENGSFHKLWYSEILNKVILPEIENERKIDKFAVAMALTKRGGADYQYSGDFSNFISDRRTNSSLTANERISELLTTKYNESYRFVDGINSTEAWYDDPAYSLEETGEDGVCMQCLVEDETTVEEDAGKDSEVKNAKPTEAETEHNEEASAGGVLTGDNKNELEVKETSEEVLGITDYDLYSKDEYKSLEGIFDPDDFQ